METRVTGRITPLEGGGFEVDLTVVGDAPTRAPRVATAKVQARTDDEVAQEIERIRGRMGQAAPLADSMADLLASENRTGKVARSRLLREVYLPLEAALDKGLTLEALAHGMEVAVSKGVPNVNYAKRAAEGWMDGGGAQHSSYRPANPGGSGAYDVIGGE